MDLPSIYPLQRIKGGGYFDDRVYSYRTAEEQRTKPIEGSQCPVDMLSLSFFWTGTEWIPAGYRKKEDIEKGWMSMQITVLFSNKQELAECKRYPERERCRRTSSAEKPMRRPSAEHIIRPVRYPNLEIWVPITGYKNGISELSFVVNDFPKPDGAPRFVSCSTRRILDLSRSSQDEIADIDLDSGHGSYCTVYPNNFWFNGGAAQVQISAKFLRQLGSDLKWLQSYLEKSIVEEH